MVYSEEFKMPLIASLPDLPALATMEPWIRTFFERIYPFIPVVEKQVLMSDLLRLSELQRTNGGSLHQVLKMNDVPVIVGIYCILAIGIDDSQDTVSELAIPFLTGAYHLVGHLIGSPYIESVRSLLLLSVALRGRGKEGQSWQILGQAIRIAHSIGLHRRASFHSSRNATAKSDATNTSGDVQVRLWWACYGLEKLMELETGRPSAISDFDCDQSLPDSKARQEYPYFTRWSSLSRIVSQISENLYRKKAASSYALLQEISRLDQTLLDWLQEASANTQISHKMSTGTSTDIEQVFANFLSIQYHQVSLSTCQLSFTTHTYRHRSPFSEQP